MCAPEGNSDFCFPESLNVPHKPTVREVRDYKRFNAECFLWDLAKLPWHVINQYSNPNE